MKRKYFAAGLLGLFILAGCESDPNDPNDPNNPNLPGPKTLTACSITSNTTLTNHNPNGVDYIVDCDVVVYDGILTIEPGTTIQFKPNRSIAINDQGAIRAVGSASNPIIMKGELQTASWNGISINSNNPLNELTHCQISGAGLESNFYALNVGDMIAGISVHGRLSITYTTVSNSAGVGIAISEYGNISGFSNNTFSNNGSYPVITYAGHLTNAIGLNTCTFNNNGTSYIGLFGYSSNKDVEHNTTLNATSIPYKAMSSLLFGSDASLSINQGVTLVFGQNRWLKIMDNGFIDINGTVSQPVTFRGEVSVPGYWGGILVTSNNPLNVFDYLNIADGGSEPLGLGTPTTNIVVGNIGAGYLTLNQCSSTNFIGNCSVVYSSSEGTLVNNSPAITDACSY